MKTEDKYRRQKKADETEMKKGRAGKSCGMKNVEIETVKAETKNDSANGEGTTEKTDKQGEDNDTN